MTDAITAFPLFVLAIGMVAALGNTAGNIIYALAVIHVPFYVRVSRAEANGLRNAGFVASAQLYGNSDMQLLARQLLPNILPAMMAQTSLSIGWVMIHATGLSFTGLGVQSPTPEWGLMIAEGAALMASGEWWLTLFPGAALMLAVLCCQVLGHGLRDWIEPRTWA